ncbi:hypothetical protein OH76DRAFT_1424224 [Lentinus brumalis]|uniref:Uncharacterized protein n=1 Tax=Lentinus brumalis TaxID=2498619 RepID=A0A371CH26_9APHY|nr:hypothetical protein OH76DRAFT_1424224 [Polyporus brumalis]
MPVCADALHWIRMDVKLVEDIMYHHDPSVWILVPMVAPMCVEDCPTPNLFPGDDFWRLCTLCDDGRGRWYHQRCLRRHHGKSAVVHVCTLHSQRPPWMSRLPSFNYLEWRELFWHRVRVLPITRGCWWESPSSLATLSYEGVLEEVRSAQVANGPDRIRELLKKHIYQPVEGEVSGAVTECRVGEAERYLNKLVHADGVGSSKYALCPRGHVC